MIVGTPNVLVVNSKLPIHNFKEFVAYTKEHGGSVNYGSAGAGSLTHLLMELLKQELGSKMVHVAYKGVTPAFTDLIAGQTQRSEGRCVGKEWVSTCRSRWVPDH